MSSMQKYIILEKTVGETPLSCAEAYRTKHPELVGVAMAYAGRLDPMASGKLLILLGDECKNQANYHGLDKEYEFSILLGMESDSLDVLGRLDTYGQPSNIYEIKNKVEQIASSLVGEIELPYPRFSAKTIQGKPLHMWTLENRLHEIEIPTKTSTVYTLQLAKTETIQRTELVKQALAKVNSIPPVTEARKALGNDFRRVDVRADWDKIKNDSTLPDSYNIIHFTCIASSGTYMRTLATIIANKLGTFGLAWHIHRTKIGTFSADSKTWSKEF